MESFHASAAGSSVNTVAASPITALIVDDEAHVRTYLRLTLRSLGVTTIWETDSGAEALALYGQQAPSIVLLDVNMPAMPGAETMRRLVALDPEVNVIVVTSDSSHENVRRFLQLGAMGYVLKQCSRKEFQGALRELLGQIAA